MKVMIAAVTAILLLGPTGAMAKDAVKAPAQKAAKIAKVAKAKTPQSKVAGTFGAWKLVCSPGKNKTQESCSLMQALLEPKSKKLVFRLNVINGKKNPVMIIRAPAGVYLPRGLELAVGAAKPLKIAYARCVPRGCRAVLPLKEPLKKDMQRAEKAKVTVYATNGKAITGTSSLKGFSDGLVALQKHKK